VARARVAVRDGMLRCIVECAPRWIQKVGVYEKLVLASEGWRRHWVESERASLPLYNRDSSSSLRLVVACPGQHDPGVRLSYR
jgi:hypothetical protein